MHRLTRTVAVAAYMVAVLIGGAGCSSRPTLPPTPNVYLQAGAGALESMPADRQTAEIDLLYATDREPVENGDAKPEYYDERRSHSLAFGHVTVRLGDDLSWEDLLRESLNPHGLRVPLEMTEVEELVRFPSSVSIPVRVDGELRVDPTIHAARDAAAEAVREELSRRLAASARKEVFIYVHGVGNSFEDPMYRMAELWHFLGRPGVPVVYTWPAVKGGGPLRGYTYSRESSEFTVYHLRQFVQAVASCRDVERIHILAHSRGTGITLSVLRDFRLIHEDDAPGARAALRIGHVILAAPDIDLQVMQQRYRPDQVHEIVDRMTVYITAEDKALGLAEFLFASLTRLGAATSENLTPEQIEALKSDRIGLDAIEVKARERGSYGHTYWIDSPAVLSDVILILRDDRPPGAEHGRPLIRADSGMWEIHDGYPYAGVHADEQERDTDHGAGDEGVGQVGDLDE